MTTEEIATIFGDSSIPQFLNSRHTIYKERGFDHNIPSREELTKLIIEEPNLLRRPITRRGKQMVIGFDKEQLTALAEG